MKNAQKYQFRFMFKSEKYRVPFEEVAELFADSDSDAVSRFFEILGDELVNDLEYMTYIRVF